MAKKRAKSDEIESIVSAMRSRRGLIIVLSAPSAAGKSTVCRRVLEETPGLDRSVSHTTRPPRKGERDGKHYRFVTRRKFEKEREEGRFLEWAEVHGNLYGTPRSFLEEQSRRGRDTILVIDVQGARAVKESFPEAVLIFLLPPSTKELERRLRERGPSGEKDIKLRLKNAKAEVSCHLMYDYIVVNESIGEAAAQIRAIIEAERCRPERLARPS